MGGLLLMLVLGLHPPPSFCDRNPTRCHTLTDAEHARFARLARRCRSTAPRLHGYQTSWRQNGDAFGFGNRGHVWPGVFDTTIVYENSVARQDDPPLSVTFTPLPVLAGIPAGRELKRETDLVILDVNTQPAKRLVWIVLGELGPETPTARNLTIHPESLPDSGRLDNVKTIVVQVYGTPELVESAYAKLDLKRLRAIVRQE